MSTSYLLDTHVLLWLLGDPGRVPEVVRDQLADRTNGLLVSAASALEISTKVRIGKLDAPAGATDEVAKYLSALDSGADEIRRMARAVKQRDLQRLTKVTGTFQAALLQVEQAEVSLSAAVE